MPGNKKLRLYFPSVSGFDIIPHKGLTPNAQFPAEASFPCRFNSFDPKLSKASVAGVGAVGREVLPSRRGTTALG